jgi:hypothetical protein
MMQHTCRHAPGQLLRPASVVLTSQCDEIRAFTFGSVYDRFHGRAADDARPSLNAFIAESVLEDS